MPLAPGLHHFGSNAAAVIANQETEGTGCVIEFDLDRLRVRVTERVDHRLSADPVDFIAEDRMQRLRQAVYDDAKLNLIIDGELVLDLRKRLFQTKRRGLR